jgi:AcrR family transcriptional regulator
LRVIFVKHFSAKHLALLVQDVYAAAVTTPSTHTTDGRTARANRTRDAVVEAMIALIEEGELRPTAKQVSERANVSLRSVFQHFADLETLFAAAADMQLNRLAPLMVRVPDDLPFEERIERFVEARTTWLETVTPVRRSAVLQEPFSREIARRLGAVRKLHRSEIVRTFAAELARFNEDELEDVVLALHVTAEWYTWETLRAQNGLSEEEARRVVSRMISALLKKER